MGLLSWLLGGGARQVADIRNGPGTFAVDVVGESHYQHALERVCGGRAEDSQRIKVEAHLVPEDNNPYDPKAVRVDIAGETVGYLDWETARSFRKQITKIGCDGMTASCGAIIVGGWNRGSGDRGHFGVKLDLPVS